MMMTTLPRDGTEIRCTSYSKSRERDCMAFGRYECRDAVCAARSCGLHVIRNDSGVHCPVCSGPVRVAKR